ncbi:hypothetical protein EMIHUDRAFT_114877 [Emiliania huxleyi CCMP1516]|uniref:PARP catalytic domain-containing protein n=2 Tax=Emiliania huxleyi TaxID=2903 RepID=A0A0D3JTS2_EMIH1|nr:hypothetical protein EMIHUDRAFT_114877 [Emiliania huxleyi CCMP1516]EOD26907.1 hypothetical protein EMIHUDRAFT_114877 [Emiliania huxleyi CCMP1516]|eukprot:XP_005779336.1 hypothetical protein EMIHUDRAFT_114877 [Emiliania huxleyi CCMP1516]
MAPSALADSIDLTLDDSPAEERAARRRSPADAARSPRRRPRARGGGGGGGAPSAVFDLTVDSPERDESTPPAGPAPSTSTSSASADGGPSGASNNRGGGSGGSGGSGGRSGGESGGAGGSGGASGSSSSGGSGGSGGGGGGESSSGGGGGGGSSSGGGSVGGSSSSGGGGGGGGGGSSSGSSGGTSSGAATAAPTVIDLMVEEVGDAPPGPSVIDLDADDASIARSLAAQLQQPADVDLQALQAARERRRRARRDRARSAAEAIRSSIERLVQQNAPRHAPAPVHLGVWLNPKSLPNEPLYERQRVPNKTIRLVFHGTPEANVGAICRDGLDPGRRAGQAHGAGEYFGGNMDVSMGYCRGGKYMLVFAVLLDKSGLTKVVPSQHGVPGEIVVVNKPEHQLPLAVVSIGCPTWSPPPGWLSSSQRLYTSADARAHNPHHSAASLYANLPASVSAAIYNRLVASGLPLPPGLRPPPGAAAAAAAAAAARPARPPPAPVYPPPRPRSRKRRR